MEWLASLSVGGVVVLFGLWFLVRHNKAIADFRCDAELSEQQRKILVSQHRRRHTSTSLIIAVGVLIPLSDIATSVLKNPFVTTLILLAILVLIAMILLYAMGDILAERLSREDLNIKKAEVELTRSILEQELAKHQSAQEEHEKNIRRNGSPD